MKVLTVYAHPQPKSFCHAVLEEFTAGLGEAGHESRVVDLYAIRFNPVFGRADFASQVDDSIPLEVLTRMNLAQGVVDSAGGPIRRMLAAQVVRGKNPQQLARLIRGQMPKDVIAQQRQVAWADGLAFVAPIHFCHFPAILCATPASTGLTTSTSTPPPLLRPTSWPVTCVERGTWATRSPNQPRRGPRPASPPSTAPP